MINVNKHQFQAVNVQLKNVLLDEQEVLIVTKDKAIDAFDEATYAKLSSYKFHNGIIEVKVLSQLLDDAPDFARGFIGIAFRINDLDTKFECIYIRPTNGRCQIQTRRNAATQYFSYPDFKYERLRIETPGKYESCANIDLNEWIDLKIIVENSSSRLYINDSIKPVLIVNDLKHGENQSGAVGLWVDIGTKGYFKDLKVTHYEAKCV